MTDQGDCVKINLYYVIPGGIAVRGQNSDLCRRVKPGKGMEVLFYGGKE